MKTKSLVWNQDSEGTFYTRYRGMTLAVYRIECPGELWQWMVIHIPKDHPRMLIASGQETSKEQCQKMAVENADLYLKD